MSAPPSETATLGLTALPANEPSSEQAGQANNPTLQHDPATASTESSSLEPTQAPQSVSVPAEIFKQWAGILEKQVKEQTQERRWKYGFRGLILALIGIALLWPVMKGGSNHTAAQSHVALIKVEGTIEYGSPAGADALVASLQSAFEDKASVAIMLQMNSPGGSPVQAGLIYDEINRLRSKYKKPVYAVVEELCASGCYYIAAAADDIYVQPASLVGSIGVIMDGFGATELMKKLGVERRMYTAGSNKGMLDPFSPATDKQKAIVNGMLQDVHQQFITAVKDGRGDALNPNKMDPDLFSGRVYTGAQSLDNGLADDLGTTSSVARDVVGVDNVVDYSPKENIAERVAKKLGASFGHGFGSTTLNSVWQSIEQRNVK